MTSDISRIECLNKIGFFSKLKEFKFKYKELLDNFTTKIESPPVYEVTFFPLLKPCFWPIFHSRGGGGVKCKL